MLEIDEAIAESDAPLVQRFQLGDESFEFLDFTQHAVHRFTVQFATRSIRR